MEINTNHMTWICINKDSNSPIPWLLYEQVIWRDLLLWPPKPGLGQTSGQACEHCRIGSRTVVSPTRGQRKIYCASPTLHLSVLFQSGRVNKHLKLNNHTHKYVYSMVHSRRCQERTLQLFSNFQFSVEVLSHNGTHSLFFNFQLSVYSSWSSRSVSLL